MNKMTLPLLLALGLSGCANVPMGPSVAVMPGPGKSFQQFVNDDRGCRAYAEQSLGTNVNDAGAANVATGAAIGTAIGAAAGALMGGHEGSGSGAGAGLLMGSAIGAGNAAQVQQSAQRRYNIAYEQCMYAKGHRLPASAPTTTYYVYPRHHRRVIIYQEQTPIVVVPSPPANAAPAPSPVPLPPPPPSP